MLNSRDSSLLSRGMLAVLTAQFFSALADNAALIAAIAILKSHDLAGHIPWLQAPFIVCFILLAPFVGHFADAFPKGKVMLLSNLVKLTGASSMLFGIGPLIAYALIGIGDAMYSPAKYGILSQLVKPALLVRANGLMEGLTIIAGLAGAVLCGWLADHSLTLAFGGVVGCYLLAALANLLIPFLQPEHPSATFHPAALIRNFGSALSLLFRDLDSRFSLIGTAIFWGCGITLRLLLFAWVPVALLIDDNQTPANLMAVIAIGIVLGAGGAGIWIKLRTINLSLLGVLLIGPTIVALAFVHNLVLAGILMVVVGICSGWFVVPLNALLQERGYSTVGAGTALAVQNFSEKVSMLLFVSMYGLTASSGISVITTSFGFGLLLLALASLLSYRRLRFA